MGKNRSASGKNDVHENMLNSFQHNSTDIAGGVMAEQFYTILDRQMNPDPFTKRSENSHSNKICTKCSVYDEQAIFHWHFAFPRMEYHYKSKTTPQ
jgi:hypothetical protein